MRALFRQLSSFSLFLLLAAGCAQHLPARPAPAPALRPPEVILQGWPQTEIKKLAFDPSGTMLAAPLEDETLYFDVVTGTLTTRVPAGKSGPFAPRGHHFAPPAGVPASITDFAVGGDVIAGAATMWTTKKYLIDPKDYGVVHLWRVRGDDLEPLGQVRCLETALAAIAVSHDGNFVACANDLGIVVIVDRTAGRHRVYQPRPYSLGSHVSDAVFHPSKPVLAVAASTGVWAYDLERGTEERLGDTDLARAVAFSADGALLASGRATGDIDLWDTRSWQSIRTLQTKTHPILTIASDPSSPRIYFAAGGKLGAAHEAIWDLRDGSGAPHEIDKAPEAVAFDPTRDVQVRARFNVLTATEGPARKELWRVELRKATFEHVAYAAGGGVVIGYGLGYIAEIEQDHAVRAYDAKTGAELWSTPKEKGYPAAVAVSPDGALVAIAFGRRWGHVDVFEARTGARVGSFGGTNADKLSTRFASLAFVSDRRVAVSGVVEGDVAIWDVTTRAPVATVEGVRGEVRLARDPATSTVAIADETGVLRFVDDEGKARRSVDLRVGEPAAIVVAGRTLVWVGQDGSARAVNLATDTVSTLAATTTGALVAVSPGGEYLAPRDAAGAFAFRWGDRAYPFEQFDSLLNQPAIALQTLGSAAPEAVSALAAARARRLEQLGISTTSSRGAVPTVRLPEIPPVVTAKRLTLHVSGADASRRLRRLHIIANGVPIFGERGKEIARNGRFEDDVVVELVPGPNKLQATVENEDGVVSLEATAITTYVGAAPKPAVHVLAIGVTHYRDRSLDLTYPAKDAADVAAALCGGGRCAATVLADAQATRAAIAGLRKRLETTAIEDTVVLYVSGHGALDKNGGYVFAPHDVDARDLERTALPYASLEGLLDGIPARHKLLVMDTCHAGELDPDELREVTRGGRVKGVSGGGVSLGLRGRGRRDLFAELRRGTGTHVLASSSGVEYAFEDPAFQNSVFTYALLKGLRERAADPRQEGPIRVSALRAYVAQTVGELTAGHQTPTARRENLDADFDLTPDAPRPPPSALDECRLDRKESAYSCGQLQLGAYGVLPDAAKASLDAAAKREGLTLTWDGLRFTAHMPGLDHPIEGGVMELGAAEGGYKRLLVCRAGHALPEVLARCDRAIAALRGQPLPELLPP